MSRDTRYFLLIVFMVIVCVSSFVYVGYKLGYQDARNDCEENIIFVR